MTMLRWIGAPGATLDLGTYTEMDGSCRWTEIEIIAQRGTTIQIDGCDGAALERDGRALAAAKSKTLSAAGKPVIIRSPGKSLMVKVVE